MPAWSRGVFGSKCFYSIGLANLIRKRDGTDTHNRTRTVRLLVNSKVV